jgi:hypothetical protein
MCMLIAPALFWIGTASYSWILVKSTTSSLTHSHGAAGANGALFRMRWLLILGTIIGTGTATVCSLWNRLSTTLASQEAAMITYYSGTTIGTTLSHRHDTTEYSCWLDHSWYMDVSCNCDAYIACNCPN